jgi:hypothetical protein
MNELDTLKSVQNFTLIVIEQKRTETAFKSLRSELPYCHAFIFTNNLYAMRLPSG